MRYFSPFSFICSAARWPRNGRNQSLEHNCSYYRRGLGCNERKYDTGSWRVHLPGKRLCICRPVYTVSSLSALWCYGVVLCTVSAVTFFFFNIIRTKPKLFHLTDDCWYLAMWFVLSYSVENEVELDSVICCVITTTDQTKYTMCWALKTSSAAESLGLPNCLIIPILK